MIEIRQYCCSIYLTSVVSIIDTMYARMNEVNDYLEEDIIFLEFMTELNLYRF